QVSIRDHIVSDSDKARDAARDTHAARPRLARGANGLLIHHINPGCPQATLPFPRLLEEYAKAARAEVERRRTRQIPSDRIEPPISC
ncbi:hypothetical protein LB507_010062, partial [Fusarium sp. FIESC RH6]